MSKVSGYVDSIPWDMSNIEYVLSRESDKREESLRNSNCSLGLALGLAALWGAGFA